MQSVVTGQATITLEWKITSGREENKEKTHENDTLVAFRRWINSYFEVYSLGSTRPLCCDQPETLTQGYYPRVDSPVINAAPRRRELLPR